MPRGYAVPPPNRPAELSFSPSSAAYECLLSEQMGKIRVAGQDSVRLIGKTAVHGCCLVAVETWIVKLAIVQVQLRVIECEKVVDKLSQFAEVALSLVVERQLPYDGSEHVGVPFV